MDKIKIVSIGETSEEEESERSGDLVLINSKSRPTVAESVTISPVEDSLERLQAIELDGDEIEDEDIMERFLTPYLNLEEDAGKAMLKKGNLLTITDANGVSLDFVVGDIEMDGDTEEPENDEESK